MNIDHRTKQSMKVHFLQTKKHTAEDMSMHCEIWTRDPTTIYGDPNTM